MFEILNMLLANKAELVDVHKIFLMLSTNTEEKLARFPSPRVLNPHVKFSRLPRQLKEKGSNIVLVLRNPKDVAVSFYHHHKGWRCTTITENSRIIFLYLLKEIVSYIVLSTICITGSRFMST